MKIDASKLAGRPTGGFKVVFVKETPLQADLCPSMTPYLFVDGKLMGLFRKISVSTDTEVCNGMIPILTLERILCGRGDEVLTMSAEEFKKWKRKIGSSCSSRRKSWLGLG